MTTTAPTTQVAAEPTTGATIPPATRFRRRAIGVAGVVGGLTTFAGFAATVWESSPAKVDYLNSLVVDPLRSQVAAVLLHFGYMCLLPVVIALAVMTRRRWRVAGNVGLGLSFAGVAALPGLLVTDFYDLAMRQNLPVEDAVRASDAAQHLPLAFLLGGISIPVMVLGMAVLSVAAWRARFFHWVFAVPMIALFFTADMLPPTVGGIAQGAAFAVFMAAAGIAALRMNDEEWVTGTHR